MPEPRLIPTREAAAMVSRSPKRFLAWARRMAIPCVGQGTAYLWDPKDIEWAIHRSKHALPCSRMDRRRLPPVRLMAVNEDLDDDELFREADEAMEARRLTLIREE